MYVQDSLSGEGVLSEYIKAESTAPFVDCEKTPESGTSMDYY